MVEVVKIQSSERANLSANFLRDNTTWPNVLRNDYLSIYGDNDVLFNNDALLEAAVNANADNINRANSMTASLDSGVAKNRSRLCLVESELQRVRALSVSW